jgi:hypothetical protein
MICVMYKVDGVPQFCHAILEDESYIETQAKYGMWVRDSIVWFPIQDDGLGFWKAVTPNADDAALLQGGRRDADVVRDDVR